MMLATGSFFFITLLFTGVVSSERVCSYHEVLDHLNMSTLNSLYSMTRPVKDYRKPTVVSLEVILYAILDVREIDQTFIPYVWIFTSWHNEHISWDPEQFCGIKSISLPTELLWKPDLTIEEMIEKDKAPPSPHLTIFSSGSVHVQNDQVLLSTCKMNIYQFPFDRQSCNLTFKSVIHSGTPAASLAQLRRSHQVVAGGDVYAERVALYRHGGRQQDRQRVRHPAKHDRLYHQHEEETCAVHHQLPAARHLLPGSGLGLLLHLGLGRREAELQGHRAAGRHRHAAHPQRDPALLLQQDPSHSRLLHRHLCSDAAQPVGDHLCHVPDGERHSWRGRQQRARLCCRKEEKSMLCMHLRCARR
ncbi:acetylcholine receptor subunit beta-like isoform X3 [Phyllopteryx taeniolatus]|uniref:acetylcholine receptor subunit beta-like isoform X3 n=1 Tax=Phyllopteryx taeniolatus TaxID=161469 RepID=UPI002AD40F81|nr:acetylcholine receptor subunit beta-like isoform X3 [Phyllopteryx taeniolatus]